MFYVVNWCIVDGKESRCDDGESGGFLRFIVFWVILLLCIKWRDGVGYW